jgi:hypothetical protein
MLKAKMPIKLNSNFLKFVQVWKSVLMRVGLKLFIVFLLT